MKILVIADIHGNFPALLAIEEAVRHEAVDLVLNCGDCTVYAPFPSEVMAWLRARGAVSVRGNTDARLTHLLTGGDFRKPRKPEKRCMYEHTATTLDAAGRADVLALPDCRDLHLAGLRVRICHGSPDDPEEFLFPETPDSRFLELARGDFDLALCGHSHTPFDKTAGNTRFINPGAAGRMFDGDPRASFALLTLGNGAKTDEITVEHRRVAYDVEAVARELARQNLPAIYAEMFRQGRKLN